MNLTQGIRYAASAAGLAWVLGASQAFAGVQGERLYPTGNNPHNWQAGLLENMISNASDIVMSMSAFTNFPPTYTRVFYDYRNSGIDFSDTNRYTMNAFDQNGNLFAVGPFSTNGTGKMTFQVGGQSPFSTNVLAEGSEMHFVVTDRLGLLRCLGGPDIVYNIYPDQHPPLVISNSFYRTIGSTNQLKIDSIAAGENSVTLGFIGFEGVTYNIHSSVDVTARLTDWQTIGQVIPTIDGPHNVTVPKGSGDHQFYLITR